MLCRPQAILLDSHTLLLPVEGGWHIETYPEGMIVGKISRLLVLGMVFRTCTAAAGTLRSLVTERLGGIQTYCILIAGLILVRIEGTDNLIIQRALDIVEILRIIRVITVQILAQLDEVIRAAGFVDIRISLRFAFLQSIGCHTQNLGIWLAEHLSISYTTHRIHVSALHQSPEVLSQIIIVWLLIALVAAQRSDNHRNMLVGMTGTDVIDVLAQRIIELRCVETVGCLEELCLFIRIGNHLRKTGERFTHTSHLTGDVHVPHLVAVARRGSALILGAVLLYVSAVVHAVPYPESHILGDEESLIADFLIIKVGCDVYQTGKLLVYAVIRSPNPIGVVVSTIHFNQSTMLSRNGVDIAVTIKFRVLLILIKSSPGALHLSEFCLRSEITSLPVALQILIIYEGLLLAFSELVHHSGDVLAEDGFLLWVSCHGVCLCDSRHIVA